MDKHMKELFKAAKALLDRIDNITTKQFSMGGERKEREALRAILAKVKGEGKSDASQSQT